MNANDYKCFFPIHLDSGNRGCEAIARGTIKILGLKKENYIGMSKLIENDEITGLDREISYVPIRHSILNKLIYRTQLFNKDEEQQRLIDYQYRYGNILNSLDTNSITFITGGDMMCYGNNEVNYITDVLHKEGKKTVLWGCSIGEENLTPEKIEILNYFDLITARESMTYKLLKEELKLKNVYCFPDPAFVLAAEKIELPDYFDFDCVGVNVSNFVTSDVGLDTMMGKNIINLINYILDYTKLHIVFFPHVFWPEQDDRVTSDIFTDYYKKSARVHMLDTYKMNYCQIRYAISKLSYFIGARTHAMISAYSMCVPSLALGYSVKSKGIAKDLGMPDYTVLDYRSLSSEEDVVNRFRKLMDNKDDISRLLLDKMPYYSEKAYDAKKCIDELL